MNGHARARPARARGPSAQAGAGWGGRAATPPKLREEREAGPALAGSRAREGEAAVSVRCACACVEESCARAKRGDGTRAHAPTPAAGARVPSCSPRLLRAVGHPVRARVNFSARERAQVRDFFAAGARSCRSLPRCPWAAGGAGVEGVLFPLLTPLPSFCCGYWSSKKKGVAGGAAGCAGEARTSTSRSPLPLPPARTPADRTVLSFHRFALLLPLRWPRSQATHVPVPKPFSSPPPSSSLTVSRRSPPQIHVIAWASFPSLNTGAPQASWPVS